MKTRTAPPDSPTAFARRFRLLMSYHNLTLGDIAAATRSAVSTVGTWKNGRVPSSVRVLDKLAEIFHVRVEYLLVGRGRDRYRQFSDAGHLAEGEAEEAAGRILDELESLREALLPSRQSVSNGHDGTPGGEGGGGGAPGSSQPGPRRAGKGAARAIQQPKDLRRQVEGYVRAYLDRAERAPGGLAHAWVQLRREFPLDLYEQLR